VATAAAVRDAPVTTLHCTAGLLRAVWSWTSLVSINIVVDFLRQSSDSDRVACSLLSGNQSFEELLLRVLKSGSASCTSSAQGIVEGCKRS
jgi:hypothetical protein